MKETYMVQNIQQKDLQDLLQKREILKKKAKQTQKLKLYKLPESQNELLQNIQTSIIPKKSNQANAKSQKEILNEKLKPKKLEDLNQSYDASMKVLQSNLEAYQFISQNAQNKQTQKLFIQKEFSRQQLNTSADFLLQQPKSKIKLSVQTNVNKQLQQQKQISEIQLPNINGIQQNNQHILSPQHITQYNHSPPKNVESVMPSQNSQFSKNLVVPKSSGIDKNQQLAKQQLGKNQTQNGVKDYKIRNYQENQMPQKKQDDFNNSKGLNNLSKSQNPHNQTPTSLNSSPTQKRQNMLNKLVKKRSKTSNFEQVNTSYQSSNDLLKVQASQNKLEKINQKPGDLRNQFTSSHNQESVTKTRAGDQAYKIKEFQAEAKKYIIKNQIQIVQNKAGNQQPAQENSLNLKIPLQQQQVVNNNYSEQKIQDQSVSNKLETNQIKQKNQFQEKQISYKRYRSKSQNKADVSQQVKNDHYQRNSPQKHIQQKNLVPQKKQVCKEDLMNNTVQEEVKIEEKKQAKVESLLDLKKQNEVMQNNKQTVNQHQIQQNRQESKQTIQSSIIKQQLMVKEQNKISQQIPKEFKELCQYYNKVYEVPQKQNHQTITQSINQQGNQEKEHQNNQQ